MNILILDEDIKYCEYLREIIKNIVNEANIIVEADGYEAINIAERGKLDLVILSVKKATEKSDFFFAQRIVKVSSTDVMIISDDEKLAIKAFNIRPFYYFIYPLDEILFHRKLYEWILLREEKKSKQPKRINIECENRMQQISLGDICYIERLTRGLIIVTETSTYEVTTTLREISKQLDKNFIQTYQSYIVNMDKIRELEMIENRTWKISFGRIDKCALLSRYKSKEFFEEFNKRLK